MRQGWCFAAVSRTARVQLVFVFINKESATAKALQRKRFRYELAGYRAAFRALKNYDFIDSNRVYILGISNGGGFCTLVPESEAEQRQVARIPFR